MTDRLHRIPKARLAIAMTVAVAAAVWGNYAGADVVVLRDGTRLEGIATTSPLVPDVVLFSDHQNKSLRLPRNKLQEIIKESEAASRLRIARNHAREAHYEQALEQIREAKRLAPDDPAVVQEERTVLQAMAVQQSRKADVETQQARGLLDKIREAMAAKQFEKALAWFTMLEDPGVSEDVRNEATRLKIDFYDRWGDDRVDRLDTFGAIENYEAALDLDPNAVEIHKKLMGLYEQFVRPGTDAQRGQRLKEHLAAQVGKDPKNIDARLRLANLLYVSRDWDGALEQYMTIYRDAESTSAQLSALPRIEARLEALLEGRHRKSAQGGNYDTAIAQFREYQTLFPDVDSRPLYEYEYQKRVAKLGPTDSDGRVELAKWAEGYGLDDYARKEIVTALKSSPKHAEALSILEKWARADLTEIETALNRGLYAQVPSLIAQLHQKYPVEQYPKLQPINDAADDLAEKASNAARTQARLDRERAQKIADQGDQNFERGMTNLHYYRTGAGATTYRGSGNDRPGLTTTVGSYKADAVMYFENALRYYREALALDRSLGDPGQRDLSRKIGDCQRYLSLLKSDRMRRLPPGERSARRFKPQTPSPPGYNPYVYPYVYPYGQPINPLYPYSTTTPYSTPGYVPGYTPQGTYNPYQPNVRR